MRQSAFNQKTINHKKHRSGKSKQFLEDEPNYFRIIIALMALDKDILEQEFPRMKFLKNLIKEIINQPETKADREGSEKI